MGLESPWGYPLRQSFRPWQLRSFGLKTVSYLVQNRPYKTPRDRHKKMQKKEDCWRFKPFYMELRFKHLKLSNWPIFPFLKEFSGLVGKFILILDLSFDKSLKPTLTSVDLIGFVTTYYLVSRVLKFWNQLGLDEFKKKCLSRKLLFISNSNNTI